MTETTPRAGTTTGATRATMDAYLTALREGGDFGRHLAADVLWTTMETGEVIRGRDAVRDFIVEVHTVAFQAHPEIRAVHVCDDAAVLEAVFTGTHAGDFLGVPATGRQVRLPYTVVYRVADGHIAELRAYLSMAALHGQVTGAQGSPAPPA